MGFLLISVMMMIGPFSGAVILKKKFGTTIGLWLGIIMSVLYLFYVFNAVNVGFWVVVAAAVLLLGWSVAQLVRKRIEWQEVSENFLSSGFYIFLLLAIILRIYVNDSTPILWDELRQWAAMPKAIFVTEELQLGKNALIFSSMQNYYPGLGLLQYFFEKINGCYVDWVLYFVYAVLGSSFVLPICDRISKKYWWTFFVYAISIFLLPLSFYNNSVGYSDYEMYYKTLFIDGLLGLAVTGSLLACWELIEEKTVFHLIRWINSICILMLLKESGMLFAILIIALYAVASIKNIRNHFGIIITSWIPIIVIKISWEYAMMRSDIDIHREGSWISLRAIAGLLLHPTDTQKTVLSDFLKNISSTPLLQTGTRFNHLFSWVVFLAVYLIFAIFLLTKFSNKNLAYVLIGGAVIDILYQISLLLMYALKFQEILSFIRYTNTGVMAIYGLLFCVMISCYLQQERHMGTLMVYGILFSFLIFDFKDKGHGDYTNFKYEMKEISDRIEDCVINAEGETSELEESVDLFYLSRGKADDVLPHHQIYYQLMDRNI